jgi:hypothetical protein
MAVSVVTAPGIVKPDPTRVSGILVSRLGRPAAFATVRFASSTR